MRDTSSHIVQIHPGQRAHPEILGTGAAMRKVFTLMESAIESPVPVLLQGEPGTGKELIARTIHQRGARGKGPFVTLRCGGMSDEVLLRELFGYCKDAVPGALLDKPGLLEAAETGTLLIDEIEEMGRVVQAELFKSLRYGEARRFGETYPRPIDAHLIAIAQGNLSRRVEQGRFRSDLYYKIAVLEIDVPPLRERGEDIEPLALHFLEKSSRKLGRAPLSFKPEALELLVRYAWPGNIQELEFEIERGVALVRRGEALGVEHLSERLRLPPSKHFAPSAPPSAPLRDARAKFERDYIAEILQQKQGNASQTAKALGISRQMLHKKLKSLGVKFNEREGACEL